MRRAAGVVALLLIALLLAFSGQALSSAQNALEIWWNAVIPSLFPFYVLIGLLQDGGMLRVLCRIAGKVFPRNAALQKGVPAFLLGALSGFPNGARVCGMLGRSDLAVYCNLCSPIFLLGVVAVNLANDIRLFFPICIAHYGSAAALFLLTSFAKRKGDDRRTAQIPPTEPTGLLGIIANGMMAMLRIGGCIVFFTVLSTLLTEIGLFPLLANGLRHIGIDPGVTVSMLKALLEMTSGCAAVSELSVSARLSAALYAAAVSFGGCCILVQARMEDARIRSLDYLLGKALQATVAGMIAFLLAPLFLQADAPVMQFPTPETVLHNTVSGLSLFTAALVGVFGTYVISACLYQVQKRTGDRSPVNRIDG